MKSLICFLVILFSQTIAIANCDAVRAAEPSQFKVCDRHTASTCPNCPSGQNEEPFFMSPPLQASKVYSCNDRMSEFENFMAHLEKPFVQDKNKDCVKAPAQNGKTEIGRWIAAHVSGYPKNCGYNMYVSVKQIEKQAPRPPAETPSCGPSMCVSATFYAFSNLVRKLNAEHRLPGGDQAEKDLTSTHGLAFKMLNQMARPDELVKQFELGEGAVLSKTEIGECSKKGWPHKGDIIQMWRQNGSGHSAIFQGMLYGDDGSIRGLCYWTSNEATKGYGKRCEELKNVKQLIVGRITI